MPAFTLWTEQQVLLAVVRGGWNERTALDYADAFKQAAKPLLGQPWAHIVYLDDWQLGVPEIEPIVRGLVSWCLDNGLRHAAHVYSPNMVKQYQLNKMISDTIVLGPNEQFEKRIYHSDHNAFAWLNQLGFATDSLNFQKKIA